MNKLKIVVVVLLLSLVTVACSNGEEAEEATASNNMQQEVAVEVEEAQIGEVVNYINLGGRTEPSKEVQVTPQAQGEVVEVYVSTGQQVEEGERLLKIDEEPLRVELNQAQATLKAAQANLDRILAGEREEKIEQLKLQLEQAESGYQQVKREYQRQQELYEKNAISNQQFEQSELEYINASKEYQLAELNLEMAEIGARDEEIEAAKAEVEQAEAGLDGAKIQYDNRVVTAPIDGQVYNLNIEAGEMVANSPVVAIADLEEVKVSADLSERYINQVQVGQLSQIEIPSLEQEYEGELTEISPVAGENRSYGIEINLTNQNDLLKGGMYSRIKLETERSEEAIVLPQQVVALDNDQDVVFVYQDGQAERREVETGLMDDQKVAIKSGVEVGEQVIIRGQENLNDGDSIQIMERGGN
ncbi:efflux RND transporter periplasmic adaptor subunit [Natroniella sulfidigena]|uniref:efflux RND transporter periplasmic adaptor subunit n=1 Tax=Natroniella sulfidigena TaxID=723921 RepID=UPI00200B9AB8|nr:efflux RND transporter periplasmic adaptor subunit [Natroniella sulfidigena]MCK8815776.1 efflux RND transporter periplasmic adaptor subunit [Natroniella sulfidigena]